MVGGISLVSCGGDDDEIDNSIENNGGNGNSGTGSSNPTGSINGHDYVDLGLSVKWATCNIGASSPEEPGNYYAWGETSTKNTYSEENYRFSVINIGNDICETKYDAAYVNWGSKWRMPTKSEFEELLTQCTWKINKRYGMNGFDVIGKNGQSIFLPRSGSAGPIKIIDIGAGCYYWSGTKMWTETAYMLNSYPGRTECNIKADLFYEGHTIRPVSTASGDTEGGGNNNDNTGGGTTTYEKPDIGFYDFTATKTSLKVQYKIYNKDKAKVTSAKIYYGTSSNPTSSKTATVSGVLITANISGLKAGTTYYVKCVATGKGGTTTTTTTRCITNY